MQIENEVQRVSNGSLALWHAIRHTARAMPSKAMQGHFKYFCYMSVSNTFIYRMLHWQNVEWVLKNGMCCRSHAKADPNYINIGMEKLIHDRHPYLVPIADAGHLGDYVPFYFAGHSPMLLMIKNGTKGVTQRPQEDIVYVVCTVQKIVDLGLPFVFTDRHAKRAMAH